MCDKFIGRIIHEYIITVNIGTGAIGSVYKAYNEKVEDYRAIKFILLSSLRDGWDNEIIKVNKLKQQENVVKYHTYGILSVDDIEYVYIMWDYIEGDSLKSLISSNSISITILIDVIRCCLKVLHACSIADIIHADMHSGNILIQKEDRMNIDDSYRKIWITDFSYITQHSDKEYLHDFDALNQVVHECLNSIVYNRLNGEQKRIRNLIKNEFSKDLLEKNATVGDYVGNAKNLLALFEAKLAKINDTETTNAAGIGDFLAAEHLGENFEEWKTLFVPKFIALDEIISRNISVLTGLRGCGKTMLFMRLSAYFNKKLGSLTFSGSDSFVGIYLNARSIPEAFPWLPDDKKDEARNQVIHHFNLRWCYEILVWIKEINKSEAFDVTFLNRYFKEYFPNYFSSGGNSQSILYLIDLINTEIQKSRLQSNFKADAWALSTYDFLESFVKEIKRNIPDTKDKPFYFFLDDYSTPMVKESTQLILNPIIFRRSSEVVFKVSTESVESFLPVGLNGKALEENADYTLIDCGAKALTKSRKYIEDILSSILQPRLERHPALKEKNPTLLKLLGKTRFDNEKLANNIKEGTGKYLYQGKRIFCDVWSSDIREMINILAIMISSEDDKNLTLDKGPLITDKVQNQVYMEIGGQFMSLLSAATDPTLHNYELDKEHAYAKHLVDIVKSFQEITSFELKTKTSKNQNNITIKKARRIEITNVDKDIPVEIVPYYRGLIRYGIFIRDYRGKSVRGKVVPRLVLKGSLIPY
ncbi:MAG: protein kinase, partial [Firmicutes bacterium]|nr:protein kinase [Bacillota bacterium]